MKLIIRKKDSVSSILMFIFNVFLLPSGQKSIGLSNVLKILGAIGKNETTTRMALSRAVQNGLLAKTKDCGEVSYHLTPLGKSAIDSWRLTIKNYQDRIRLQHQPWNGNWQIVTFSIPGTKQSEKGEFTDYLENLGFGILNKGVWISPYDYSQIVAAMAMKLGIRNHVHLFSACPETGQSVPAIVDCVWNIDKLKKRYARLSRTIEQALAGSESLTPREILPLLHGLGLEFLEVIQDDPQLPLQILPGKWSGGDCAGKFMQLRERLLPRAKQFINSLI